MISGYPGVRITDSGLTIAPFCPEGANSIRLRSLRYRGAVFDLQYSCSANTQPESMQLSMSEVQGQRQFRLIAGKKVLKTLSSGDSVSINFKQLPAKTSFLLA